LFVVTWLEGKNKYMGLLMIKQIAYNSLNLSAAYLEYVCHRNKV